MGAPTPPDLGEGRDSHWPVMQSPGLPSDGSPLTTLHRAGGGFLLGKRSGCRRGGDALTHREGARALRGLTFGSLITTLSSPALPP